LRITLEDGDNLQFCAIKHFRRRRQTATEHPSRRLAARLGIVVGYNRPDQRTLRPA
jgi:hypothetical protein